VNNFTLGKIRNATDFIAGQGRYSFRGVKVVIQHKTSFQYVKSDTDWTEDAFRAHDFQRIQSAAEFCRTHNLRTAYIVAGDFNAEAKRFNAATKCILDIAQLRAASTS